MMSFNNLVSINFKVIFFKKILRNTNKFNVTKLSNFHNEDN